MPERVPEESVADNLHRSFRLVLATMPFVGGTAVELFNWLLAPPIQRRRDAWLNELAERITKLEQEGRVKLEDLMSNDEFVSTVMQATQVAVGNHQQEKINALRNAVLNTAISQAPSDSKREIFMGFIDVFSLIHFRILKTLADSDAKGQERVNTSIPEITGCVLKLRADLCQSAPLVEIAVEDMCRRGLLFWNREGSTTYIKQGTTQVSELGHEFLDFISEPMDNG